MPRRLVAIAALSFGMALLVVDGNIAIVALPTIARKLGVSEGAVTAVITVYQLVTVMGLLPFANLGDRIGHRRMYQSGQVLFCIASALCFFVESFPVLLLLRAAQAIGASMSLSVSAAILREIYPTRSLGSGMGFNSMVVALASATGPTLGGFIVASFDWRLVFVAAAPFALLSLLFGPSLPPPDPRRGKTDWVAALWSAFTMACLIGGVQLASHASVRLPGIGLFLAGGVSAWLLVRRERRIERPIVPVDILKMPAVGLSALGAMAVFCAVGLTLIALPFRLEQGFGFRPDEVGLLILPFPLTMLFVAPTAGWLSDRIAPTKLGVPGLAVAILGLTALMLLPPGATKFDLIWRLSLTAAGFGFFMAPNSRLLIGSTPKERTSAAGGVMSTARLLGLGLAAAVLGLLLGLGAGLGPMPLLIAMGLAVLASACSLVRFRTVRAARRAAGADAGI